VDVHAESASLARAVSPCVSMLPDTDPCRGIWTDDAVGKGTLPLRNMLEGLLFTSLPGLATFTALLLTVHRQG